MNGVFKFKVWQAKIERYINAEAYFSLVINHVVYIV